MKDKQNNNKASLVGIKTLDKLVKESPVVRNILRKSLGMSTPKKIKK